MTRVYTYTWDRTSNLTKVKNPDKTRQVNTYDAAGQLATRSYLLGANEEQQILASFDFQRDADGRITSIRRETGQAFEYTYDALGRLLTSKLPPDLVARLRSADGPVPTDADAAATYRIRRVLTGSPATYTYDPAGNRTRVESDGGVLDATYTDTNQLLTFGGLTYTYDVRGFQTAAIQPSGALRAFDYDAAGRLTSVRAGPSATSLTLLQSNFFDPDARRVTQWDASTNRTTHTLWDGLTPIDTFWAGPTAGTERGMAMFDGGGASEQRPYVRTSAGTRAPVNADGWAEYTGVNAKSQLEWMLPDHLGSPAVLANYQGGVTGTMAFGAWGEELEGSFARTSMTYAGTQRNPGTGLQQAWNRWYDASQGRFLSRDPIGFAGGLNLYAYVKNNPINARDPSGLVGETMDWRGDSGDWTIPNTRAFLAENRKSLGELLGDAASAASPVATPIAVAAAAATVPPVAAALEFSAGAGLGFSLGNAVKASANYVGDPTVQNGCQARSKGWDATKRAAEIALFRVLARRAARESIPGAGQWHHPLSNPVMEALENHPNLAGHFERDDFLTQAANLAAHNGYDRFHQNLDDGVVAAIQNNPQWTPTDFVAYLTALYNTEPLRARFPGGLDSR